MNDEFLAYYHGELAFLRELGAEFAERYPKVAGRLLLEADKCEDPHVERLLEGFAFLTARIRQKIDDEFPEVSDALLGLLYPHYQRPIPSMSVVQFVAGPAQADLASGYVLARESRLNSRPVGGAPCAFRTAYPVTLWPIEVAKVQLVPDRVVFPDKPPQAVALLQWTLRSTGGMSFAEIPLDRLRFFLDGTGPNPYTFHELLLNNVCGVLARGQGADGQVVTVELARDALQPVGFGRDEGLVPYPNRSFLGYRLLQEYFTFPEKFLFVDLTGLHRLAGRIAGETLEILVFLDQSPRSDLLAQPENFRLGCAPIVNLFHQVCEPIALDQTQTEYRVIPDVHRQQATEVYAIDEVVGSASYLDEPVRYEPFYSIRHSFQEPKASAFWYATRRPSLRKDDPGTDVFLSFVDRGFRLSRPSSEMVTVRATCTNRDLPSKLPFGGAQGDFELEAPGPVSRVRCLRKPSRPLRPPLGRDAQWRLISHLALNHLSLADSEEGLDALREILKLYDFADSSVTRQQIAGISHVSSRRTTGRTGRKLGNVAGLGVEITVEFDETQYVGSGVFLLASVLERFLGLYVSINSFSQLVARTRQREGLLRRWPPRTGERTLL